MPARTQPPRPRPDPHGTGLLLRGVHLTRGLLATAMLTALVAGIPWGLARYIGWPLPRHVPTWPEIEAALLAPMSTNFLLHTLACILWPVWSAFVLDVARAIVDAARAVPRPVMPHAGPLNALAAVLVGTIIMALLAQRPTTPTASAPAPAATSTATTMNTPTPVPARLVDFAEPATAQVQGRSPTTGTVEVEPPRDGIYDSLWRIADRTLGDGNRWPEIYALNRGRSQPDGHILTNPNLIRPGWILRLPDHPSAPDTQPPGSGKTLSPSPASPQPPHASAPTTPTPGTPPPTSSPTTPSTPSTSLPPLPSREPSRQPGISLSTGAFVGIGLAGLITIALLTVRRRRRVRYRPGSGDRDDLTVAPVVRALRLAYDDALRTDDPETPPQTALPAQLRSALPDPNGPTGESASVLPSPTPQGRVIGVKDGQGLAWDLARAHGLGLIGPGALDAIRALLVTLLAEPRQPHISPAEILIPASDAEAVIGQPPGHPSRLHIVKDLDTALDTMERELLTRIRTDTDPDTAMDAARLRPGDLVLVATPAPHAERRLQAVLDNGSSFGLVGVLLGQWRPGGTARIRLDGTVAATSSPVAGVLTDARLFTLPTTDTQALLDLLHDAQSAPQPLTPRDPATMATSSTALGRPDLETGPTTTPRPMPVKPGSRLAHGPAPTRPGARQASPADDRQDLTEPNNAPRTEPSPKPRDDDPPPATTAAQPLRVPDPKLTFPPTDDASVPRPSQPARDRPRDPRSTPPAQPPSTTPEDASPTRASEGATTQQAPNSQRPLQLTVLGRMHLTHHQSGGHEHADLSPALAPKQREVLAYLALHRDGARREALATAIWPDAPRDRPYNSFHATLSQLRRALRTATHNALSDVTFHADGHYGLDQNQIMADLWHLQDVLETSRQDTNEDHHRTALESAVDLYTGDLAADVTAEWIEAPREALRRDVLDAVSTLVRILRDDEPEQALSLLERARTLDRYNEAIYRDIARFQAHLGRHDAIPRTLALLTTTLADIDDHPSRETVTLCELLQHPHPAKRTTSDRAAS